MPARTMPVRNAAGTSRSPAFGPRRSRSAPTSTEVGSCQLGPPRPSEPDHHGPRRPSSSRGRTGCRPRPSSAVGCPRTGRRPRSHAGARRRRTRPRRRRTARRRARRSHVGTEPGEVLGRGLESSAGGASSSSAVASATHGVSSARRRVRRTTRLRRRRRAARLPLDGRLVADVLVLDRLAHQFVDRLQHAGVVPGGVVVVVLVDRGRGAAIDRRPAPPRSRSARSRTGVTATCSSSAAGAAAPRSSDSASRRPGWARRTCRGPRRGRPAVALVVRH